MVLVGFSEFFEDFAKSLPVLELKRWSVDRETSTVVVSGTAQPESLSALPNPDRTLRYSYRLLSICQITLSRGLVQRGPSQVPSGREQGGYSQVQYIDSSQAPSLETKLVSFIQRKPPRHRQPC